MPSNKIPDEVVVAKLSIEASLVALESLFEKMKTMPRADKVMVSDALHQAVAKLHAAQALLTQLETVPVTSARPAKD